MMDTRCRMKETYIEFLEKENEQFEFEVCDAIIACMHVFNQ